MTTHIRRAALFAVAWAGSTCGAWAASAAWSTDFEAAKSRAAAEHKDLLIDFTGSDWCAWCQKLDKEVFEKAPFEEKIQEKFVLVELDYPQDTSKQEGRIQSQNRSLLATYPISGYPTVLLCDENGAPYAATGYQEGGPEKYLEKIEELRGQKTARDEAFAKAEKAEGVEKAKLLLAGLEATQLPEKMVNTFYMGITSELKKADPKDETGFAAKEAALVQLNQFQNDLGRVRGDLENAKKFFATTLADPATKGEFRQMVHGYEAASYAYAGKKPEAIAVLEAAVKEDPEGKRTQELQDFIVILQKEIDKEAAAKPAGEAAVTPAPAEEAKPAAGE